MKYILRKHKNADRLCPVNTNWWCLALIKYSLQEKRRAQFAGIATACKWNWRRGRWTFFTYLLICIQLKGFAKATREDNYQERILMNCKRHQIFFFSKYMRQSIVFFFLRIYSFLVFGISVKSSGLVGLPFIVLPWWVTPRCKDFKECLKKILTLTMLCNVDNTHQLLHTNLISKVAGLLLDSGANSKLRNNQGLKKNNSQYLSIECINSRELGRPESIIFFIFFRENKASFPRTKKGRF